MKSWHAVPRLKAREAMHHAILAEQRRNPRTEGHGVLGFNAAITITSS
jgi:hypothetical protein